MENRNAVIATILGLAFILSFSYWMHRERTNPARLVITGYYQGKAIFMWRTHGNHGLDMSTTKEKALTIDGMTWEIK